MRILIVALCLFLLWPAASFAGPQEAEAVRATMKGIWEKPGAPLTIDPVSVVENYALADWEQGGTGGRALLRKKGGRWEVLLCAGDEIRHAQALRSVGVPEGLAERLAAALAQAEQGIPRSRLERLASFKGLVRVSPDHHSHQQEPKQ